MQHASRTIWLHDMGHPAFHQQMSKRDIRTLQRMARHSFALQYAAPHCNTLQHTAAHCSTLQHTHQQISERDIRTWDFSDGNGPNLFPRACCVYQFDMIASHRVYEFYMTASHCTYTYDCVILCVNTHDVTLFDMIGSYCVYLFDMMGSHQKAGFQ